MISGITGTRIVLSRMPRLDELELLELVSMTTGGMLTGVIAGVAVKLSISDSMRFDDRSGVAVVVLVVEDAGEDVSCCCSRSVDEAAGGGGGDEEEEDSLGGGATG